MKSQNLFLKVFGITLLFTIGSLVLTVYAIQRTEITSKNIEEKLKSAFPDANISFNMDNISGGNHEETEQKWTIAPPSDSIEIKSVSGNFEIGSTTEDQIQIRAQGQLDSKAYEHLLELVISQDTVVIKDPPRNAAQNLQVQIQIPRKFQKKIEIKNVSGNLVVKNLAVDEMEVKSVSGDIELDLVSSPKLKIETISGNLKCLNSGDGDVELKSISGNIEAKVSEPAKTKIVAKSISGDIENQLATNSEGPAELKLTTTSGNISIQ